MKISLPKKIQFLRKPIYLNFIIPLTLLFTGFVLTIFFNPVSKFTVLVYPPISSDKIVYPVGELLAQQKIQGEFEARNNNLGIVSVRFYNFKRISKDKVIFRLKEKGQEKWYYENVYKVDQFQPHGLFTFGFPIVMNSKDKTYVFEVESLYGKKGDAIGISNRRPLFVTHYQISRHEIFGDKEQFMDYIAKKTESVFSNTETLISAIIYFLPFIYYNYLTLLLSKSIKLNIRLLLGLLLVFQLYEIVFIQSYEISFFLFLMSLWSLLFLIKRIDARVCFVFAVALLVLVPFVLFFNLEMIANKLGRWIYTFLTLGLLFTLLQKKFKPRVDLKVITTKE